MRFSFKSSAAQEVVFIQPVIDGGKYSSTFEEFRLVFFSLCLAEASHIHTYAVAEQQLELNREVLRMVALVIVIRKITCAVW